VSRRGYCIENMKYVANHTSVALQKETVGWSSSTTPSSLTFSSWVPKMRGVSWLMSWNNFMHYMKFTH